MSEVRRNKWFDWAFLAFGLVIQVVTYFITVLHTPGALSPLSLISGCLGVCSVCLTAQGNILFFFFGFAQVVTYLYLCLKAHLYGEVAINVYYFVTLIYGIYAWRKRLRPEDSKHVRTRRLPWAVWLTIVCGILVVSAGVGWLLQTYTDDPTPYLDSFVSVTSVVAQILMIMVYRDQWLLWLTVDVVSIAMWLYVGDWCMTAQHAFWCANCIYGYYKWKGLEENL